MRRFSKMQQTYGAGPAGKTCKDCVFLKRVRPGVKSFLKCAVYGISKSDASDWRAGAAACGKFTERET
jgi:hypothetical protein